MKHTQLLHIVLATAAVAFAASCSVGPRPEPATHAARDAVTADRTSKEDFALAAPAEPPDYRLMMAALRSADLEVMDELVAARNVRPVIAYPMPSVASALAGIRHVKEAP